MSMDDLSGSEPVHVYEDEGTGDRFLIYGTAKGARVESRNANDRAKVGRRDPDRAADAAG